MSTPRKNFIQRSSVYRRLSRDERITVAQTELIRLGCLTGAADGIAGPMTMAALQRFTKAMRMPPALPDIASAEVLGMLKRQTIALCR